MSLIINCQCSYSFDWRWSVLTLVVILIYVRILFYYLLLKRCVIHWSGLVQRSILYDIQT